MAKKAAITKVLSCFVVIVFLMSSLSVAVIASDSSNSTASNVTDNANTSSPDPIKESVEVPDPNLPVLNDTDISTAKTVSSLGYCSYVWIEITDKYCKGYKVYVDGVYQFTEGEDSVPDGYCSFKVTPGYHTFKLTLNGKEVSKGWNCQCGTGYNWMSMNDMIPHWCEGGGTDNPTDDYEVKFRGTVTSTTPSEYDCGFKDVYICEVKIEKVVSGDYFEKGDIVNIVYSQCRENAHVCGTYDKVSVGDTVEVYGEMIPILCVGTWITICGKSSYYLKKTPSESLSISVWTDKSEYKIGETVTIYYQTNKKCTAKLTITKPDDGDVVYGPNEIPASTRSKSATAGYPTGKRTVVFEAWAGAEYKKATCYFDVVGKEKEVTFRGTVTYTEYSELYEWKVKVDKWINGYISCNVVDVILGCLGQQGSCDTTIRADDYVEIYGKVNEYRNCGVDLNGKSSYYIKKIVEKPDLIIQDISWSPSNPKQGDTVTINIITKNQGSGNAGGFYVCYYVDGSYYDRDYVSGLSAGSTTTTSFTWTAESGSHSIKAYVDCYDAIDESNEGNNEKSIVIEVGKKSVHNIDTGKDFATIQAAIDDSNTGHTITVDAGTYVENVEVTKSLTIKSTSGNPEDTIVQAKISGRTMEDNVFTVTADNVNIDGFTIKGASYFWCSGIWLNSNNCIISNNTFEDNAIGIWTHPPSSGNNIIRYNNFSSSSESGPSIALSLEATGNKVYLNSFIIDAGWGMLGNIWNSPSPITYTYNGNTFTGYLGNYWDDYKDNYPGAKERDNTGIWNTPYEIIEDKDNYPLVDRSENYIEQKPVRTIEFAGHNWTVKSGRGGPGNNSWSDSEESVWVDDDGLHLKITNRSGTWYCAEVVSEESFGYGKYTFYLDGRPDLFDKNVVLGLFTYLDDYHEIDIEFSGGYPAPKNSQYVIQPKEERTVKYIEGDNLHRFQMMLSKGEYSSHYFDWRNAQVYFKSMYGHRTDTDNSNLIIAEKNLDGGDVAEIPTPTNEKVHLNLWLVDADKDGYGDPPSNDQEAEIIIKDIDFPQPIWVEGGYADYQPLNVFFSGSQIDVKLQNPNYTEYTFNCERWKDVNENLFVDGDDTWLLEIYHLITTSETAFQVSVPEHVPIGLYRLKIEGTDYVSNGFWVIFDPTTSGISEKYWKDEVTGKRQDHFFKKEVMTSHHKRELMLCMAAIFARGGVVPIREEQATKKFQAWISKHTQKEEAEPPPDIIDYVHQIKSEIGKPNPDWPDADCDCLSPFLVALARASGIPAREIHGFGFVKPFTGWSWSHAWVEVFYEGKWQVLDPTFHLSEFGTEYMEFIDWHKSNSDLWKLWTVDDELDVARGYDYKGAKPEIAIAAILSSPANLHAYDSLGNHVGMNEQGGIDLEIPNAYYTGPYSEPEEIVMFGQSENIKFRVDALGEGEFDLTIEQTAETETKEIVYENVPIIETTEAWVNVSPENPDYLMEIDYEGDGTTDRKREPDSIDVIGHDSYPIQLHTGWNLISLPLTPEDTDVLNVLSSIAGNWNSVWSYEGGKWKRYDLTGQDFLNTLTIMEPGKGYWLHMKSDDTLSIKGSEPGVKSIPLSAGWNLVGYNSLNSMPTTEAMSSLEGNWNSVWSYDGGNWKRYDLTGPDFLNTLTFMEPGKGYWLNLKSQDTWTLGA